MAVNLNAPVLSAADAHKLNQAAQTLNSRLFLCCNYQPTCDVNDPNGTLESVTDDCSWYLTAIQDLYKFCVDSSCIIKCIVEKPEKILVRPVLNAAGSSIRNLEKAVGTVQILRAVKSHNQNPANGRHCEGYLLQYRNWVRGVLGSSNPVPQSVKDFEALNVALYDIADTVRTELGKLLNLLNSQPSPTKAVIVDTKAVIVENWINETFRWYATGINRAIYRAQLEADYLSRAGFSSIPAKDLRRKVNKWICEARIQNGDASGPAGIAEVNAFFGNLPSQLRRTRRMLDSASPYTPYTLLPGNFMPHDIDRYFGGVRSPEGDF